MGYFFPSKYGPLTLLRPDQFRTRTYFTVTHTHTYIQYSQRHTMINHCDRRITHLSDLDISFVLLNIISKFSFTFRVLLTITQKTYQNK